MAAKAKSNLTSNHIVRPKVKRPGVHAKSKSSKLKSSKNYSKRYYGTEGNLAVELLLRWGYKIAQQWPKDCVMIYGE